MTNPKRSSDSSVWRFNAQNCKGDDILEAGVMLKRFGDLALSHVQANIAELTDPTQQQQKQQWQLIMQQLKTLQSTLGLPAGVLR